MKKNIFNWLGLLGVVSFISYLLAVCISPIDYPEYDWLSQAVSDLSKEGAPSLRLWNKLACIYDIGSCIFVTVLCIYVFNYNKLNKLLRIGILLYAIMNYVSAIGYKCFPLSDGSEFQNVMHIVVTALVVVLSIASLVVIMVGGYKNKNYLIMAICASISLALMSTSAITGVVPKEIFGLVERFSCFSATAFSAVLVVLLFLDFKGNRCIDEVSSI